MTAPVDDVLTNPAAGTDDPEATATENRAENRRIARSVAALCAVAFVVFLVSPVHQNYDGYLTLPTAYTMVHERTLDLGSLDSPKLYRHHAMAETPDGEHVNYFPWAVSVWELPAVVALDAAHLVGFGPGSREIVNGGPMDLVQVGVASAVAVATIALVALIAADRLRPGTRRRPLAVLFVTGGFAFGTGVWSVASRGLWQHGPSMLALAAAVWCLQRLALRPPAAPGVPEATDPHPGRIRSPAWLAAGAGAALAAGYTYRPTNATAVIVLSAYLAARHRRLVVPYLAGAAAIALPWFTINLAAYGSLLQPYFSAQRVGLHAHFAEAVAANLVSPNRGLLVFSPIVVLAPLGLVARFRRTVRDGLLTLDRLLLAIVGLQVLAASAYGDNWWAGHSYGPRLLTDSLVLLAVVATPTVGALVDPAPAFGRGRRAVAGLAVVALLWSLFAASQGALFRATSCWSGLPNIDGQPERVWSVTDPLITSGVGRLIATRSVRAAVLDDCARAG